jgi:hypothetical protein
LFISPDILCRLELNYAHDVFFAHDQQLVAIDLDGLTGVLAEQHAVAHLERHRANLAVVLDLAGANGQNFTLVGLLGRVVGNDDAGSGFLLFFETLDDNQIMQRTNFHGVDLL